MNLAFLCELKIVNDKKGRSDVIPILYNILILYKLKCIIIVHYRIKFMFIM